MKDESFNTCVTAVFGAAVAGLLIAAVASYATPRGVPPMPLNQTSVIRPLDQPHCFPPGTLGTEGFPMCPDSLPDMRSA